MSIDVNTRTVFDDVRELYDLKSRIDPLKDQHRDEYARKLQSIRELMAAANSKECFTLGSQYHPPICLRLVDDEFHCLDEMPFEMRAGDRKGAMIEDFEPIR